MADEGVVVEQGASQGQNPLVEVTFQRNTQRKRKYLEAEPKALGITQICLSVYMIVGVGAFRAKGLFLSIDIPLLIFSVLVMIAGSLAIHAKNLHLPILRTCLGMQIVACASSVLNMIFTIIKMEHPPNCWYNRYDYDNNQPFGNQEVCRQIMSIHSHFYAGGIILHATLVAISATLAAYCCKVVNCCGPAPKMPVITVHTQPDHQRDA